MQQEMLLRDEETMELRGTYTSLQQEVEVKTKKLKKVRAQQGMVRVAKAKGLLPSQLKLSSPSHVACATGESVWPGMEPFLLDWWAQRL